MTRTLSYLAGLSTLILTVGCSGTTEPVKTAACSGTVDISVEAGATPTFQWAPACGVSNFWVVSVPSSPGEAEQVMWQFWVPANSPIKPPIRYGVNPGMLSSSTRPAALVPGARYVVRVQQTDGGSWVVAGGEKMFTH